MRAAGGQIAPLSLLAAAALLLGADAAPPTLSGFTLRDARVPRDQIVKGGPARDGIKSIDSPEFVAVHRATWVRGNTPVLCVEIDGVARAYPIHLLEFHQIVNDELAGIPVVVTYDPLAGTPLVFRRKVGDRTLTFGVSGLLYNSNFLLYDRETESLWSQFRGEAITGPLAGTKLERVLVRQETFARWMEREPGTRVLARPDPRRIDYRYSPFSAYWLQDEILFPVAARDERFHAKELVLGVRVGDNTRAYLGSLVTKAGGRIEDDFAGRRVRLAYDTQRGVFQFDVPTDVEVTEAYWFAWKTFHPDTEIWGLASASLR